MRTIVLFVAGMLAAVGIGLGARAAADDTPTDCVASGDGFGTVVCS